MDTTQEHINYSKAFTCVPANLFEPEKKAYYLQFLFSDECGIILHQYIADEQIVLLHVIPKSEYDAARRENPDCLFTHYMAELINHYFEQDNLVGGNQMVVNMTETGIDILCFSGKNLLLANHFDCTSTADAVYFTLNVWNQLHFDPLQDSLCLINNNEALRRHLQDYICNVIV
ncbi:hypothetical protein AGMMS4957_08350 [Bacteroidia bacterium]|nr:hypothetical protein AGMMS4957_08350 [Bacteroidia bacterium]